MGSIYAAFIRRQTRLENRRLTRTARKSKGIDMGTRITSDGTRYTFTHDPNDDDAEVETVEATEACHYSDDQEYNSPYRFTD